MKKPPLLHVGFHKTGTTSLQQDLFNNTSKGFASPWYAEVVEHFITTHGERFDPDRVRAQFYQAVEGIDPDDRCVPVLSHEALSRRNIQCEAADRLARTFSRAQVVIGIREQKSAIRSFYGEYLSGGTLTLDEYLGINEDKKPGWSPPLPLDNLEYHLLIQRYVRHFGRENILILPLELLQVDHRAYEQALHDFAGTGCSAGEPLPARRKGHKASTLAVRRQLNKFMKTKHGARGDHAASGLLFRMKNRLCRYMDQYLPGCWSRSIDRRTRRRIEAFVGDYYRPSNRELSKYTSYPLADYGYDI